MTISTTLLFNRAVGLMSERQGDLASIQEKVSTGKQLVRPSDSVDTAINVSRLKTTISRFESYGDSLQAITSRLGVEESYLGNAVSVLSTLKELAVQAANGTYNALDRKAIGAQVKQLSSELLSIANGADASGNFIFGGSRNSTAPYQRDGEGIPRYKGDIVQNRVDFSDQRRVAVGRTGLDVFTPISTGQLLPAKNEIFELKLRGSLEVGDVYEVSVDGVSFSHVVSVDETFGDVVDSLAEEINSASQSGNINMVSAYRTDLGDLAVEGLGGKEHSIKARTSNTSESLKSGSATAINVGDSPHDDLLYESRLIDLSGVVFSDQNDADGIAEGITALISLRVGDVTLSTEDRPVTNSEQLVAALQEHTLYQEAPFEISLDSAIPGLVVNWKQAASVAADMPFSLSGGGAAQSQLANASDGSEVVQRGYEMNLGLSLEGPFERGDRVILEFEGEILNYQITGLEGATGYLEDVVSLDSLNSTLIRQINSDPKLSLKLRAESYAPGSDLIKLTPLTNDSPGQLSARLIDRGDFNDQSIRVQRTQRATPPVPEKIEFFETLARFTDALESNNEQAITASIDQIGQMIDSVTLSVADVGAEMASIENELSINEDLKLQLQAALSGEEDLDYASAITDLQAKLLSLEAAQSSFAKISQLSLFDYIR